MERFSFGTYLVDEYNQQAFTTCHDIANLASECHQPIVLVGDTGTGKTHLLYSIIGRIRTSSAKAGIAYVTASEFPEEVRNLVRNPEQVEEAPDAVLLVDQLESFDTDLEILENVIDLFMKNGHAIVCATNVHPDRLQQLPRGLARLIGNGHTISILPQDSPSRVDLIENTIREEHEQVIARLEEDMAELRNFLTSTSETHSTAEDNDESLLLSLRKELEVTRAELKLAQARLNVPSFESTQSDAQSLSTQYADSIKESELQLEQLRAENALNAVAVKESFGLRKRIEALESERSELRDQIDQHHTKRLENTDEPLIDTDAREEAKSMLQRAEALVDVMRKSREEFSESQTLHAKQMNEIQELEEIFKKLDTTGEDTSISETEHAELVGQWESAVSSAESERDDLAERMTQRQEILDTLQQEFVALKKDFEEAQKQLTEKTDAYMALDLALEEKEKEKADAISAANLQIAHYEDRIGEFESSLNAQKQNDTFIQSELKIIQAQLGDADGSLNRLLKACASDDEKDQPTSDIMIDTDLLDTLEGAQLLERLNLEELEVIVPEEIEIDAQTSPDPVLHHVEEIKQNLEILEQPSSEQPEQDIKDSQAS